MLINLFNFSKKENSTKRPTGEGTSFNCILKEDTSIINPVIRLDLGQPFNPSQFNYAYIEDFNRYYFIEDWINSGSLWIASLSVDVLASFKTEIGDADLYILRSSAESDGRVIDTKYPTKSQANSYIDDIGTVTISNKDRSKTRTVTNYFDTNIMFGFYYIGVVGANGYGVEYYCLLPSGFNDLVNKLYNFIPTDMDDVSDGIARHLANPMQYITTCYWLPIAPLNAYLNFEYKTIKMGFYSFTVDAYKIEPMVDIVRNEATFNIRKHPQANDRGLYLNNAPFSNYTLNFNPFGTFSLDPSLMVDDQEVTATWYIDYATGEADLTIKSINTLIANVKTMFAIPVQLNYADVSGFGTIANGIGNIGYRNVGGLEANMTNSGSIIGNIASAVVGGFIGVEGTRQPKISSIGGGGNFLPFNTYEPKLYSDFYYIVDEYNVEIGRPLCKVRKPKNLGGYMIAQEGVIEAVATKTELVEVDRYLIGGFYYE